MPRREQADRLPRSIPDLDAGWRPHGQCRFLSLSGHRREAEGSFDAGGFMNATPIIASFGGVGINRNTPHPYAAALFTDWMLSDESQNYLAKNCAGQSRSNIPICRTASTSSPPTCRSRSSIVWWPSGDARWRAGSRFLQTNDSFHRSLDLGLREIITGKVGTEILKANCQIVK